MTNPSRRVLGIDPGLSATGYGVIEVAGADVRMIDCGVLRSRATAPRAERLARIHDLVVDLVAAHAAGEVAIEQQFVAENVRSAMAIGEARAAAMVAASHAGVPVYEFAPTLVKEAVAGWGGAPKEQVRQMVMLQLGLVEPPHPLDVSDALAIALTRAADARLDDALARA